MISTNKSIFLGLAGLLFVACGEEGTIPAEQPVPVVETSDSDTLFFEESDDYEFVAPSPLEIAQVFRSAELVYNSDFPNKKEYAANYQTKFKKSINFGSYATDLAYCIVNEETQSAQGYFAALKELGDEIGLGSVFKEEMATRFKNNLGAMDSLVEILTEVQLQTDEYIEMHGEDDLQIVYFSGAWLEGMYLGVKSIQATDRNSNAPSVVEKLSKQIELGNQVYQGLSSISDIDPEVEELKAGIESIVSTYFEFETVKEQLKQEFPTTVQLTAEEVDKISGLIIEAREQMVQ